METVIQAVENQAVPAKKPAYRVEYDDKSMPANINEWRAKLLALLQSEICTLTADECLAERPNTYRVGAVITTHGLGVQFEFWPTGKTLDKDGKEIDSLFALSVNLRAIKRQKNDNTYSAKLRAEAEAQLFHEDYTERIAKAIATGKYATEQAAKAARPFVAWVNQQRVNMAQSEKNTPVQNADNAKRLTDFTAKVNARCAMLQAIANSQSTQVADDDDF